MQRRILSPEPPPLIVASERADAQNLPLPEVRVGFCIKWRRRAPIPAGLGANDRVSKGFVRVHGRGARGQGDGGKGGLSGCRVSFAAAGAPLARLR